MRLALWTTLILLLASRAFSAETLRIEFWHSMTGEKGKLLSGLVADFNRLQEGKIEVRQQFVGSYDEGLNKLRTAVIAGRAPQVVQITDVGTALMIHSGAIVPLKSFIDSDPDFPAKLLLPAIRRYYEVDGALYSLPFATSNPILYYNADMFKAAGIERPPATFSELEAAAARLTQRDKKIFGLTWPLHSWLLEEFMAKQGVPLILPDNGRKGPAQEANYLAPESRLFVDLWLRMVKNGTFAHVGRGWDPPGQNFIAGRAAMLVTSTSDMFEVFRAAPFKLGTAPLPGADGPARGGVVVGGNSLWIMKNKDKALERASYEFVKFMASRDVQKKWHTNTGYFPIRADVIDILKSEGFYEKYPVAWTAIEQIRSSPEIIATQGALTASFQMMREHIMTAIEEILAGHADFETAMKKAKAKSDFALKREARGLQESAKP